MRILVIGASKGIGLETVRYGLERGHDIRALARHAESIPIDHPKLEKLNGDARNAGDVAAALDGVDAVIVALGVPKNVMALAPTTLFSEATRVLLSAMAEAGVGRLLVVTGFGAGESRSRLSTFERMFFNAILDRAYADKTIQEQMIRESGLDWTIARPGILMSRPPSHDYEVLVAPESWHNGLISRADVAHFLITAAEDGSHIGEAPVLVR